MVSPASKETSPSSVSQCTKPDKEGDGSVTLVNPLPEKAFFPIKTRLLGNSTPLKPKPFAPKAPSPICSNPSGSTILVSLLPRKAYFPIDFNPEGKTILVISFNIKEEGLNRSPSAIPIIC